MSDIIRLLPDSVANQIAAGEVIQRPASVLKELVENALDAGATKIDVLITDAGKTCIQVVDNGCGMSETDARLAFERHATSKISSAADLFSLHTMGFRGEALPSIAAVAQVELRTRTPESTLGVSLTIEGSRVTDQQPVACDVGSNFIVKNLFFNVPARRRFLKSNQTEFGNIVREFEKIALARPDVRFSLSNNDSPVFSLMPASRMQRIADLFGSRIGGRLLHIGVDTSIVRISGFTGTPESARKKGSPQYFFVNGRYMRHPYFSRAVMLAYERLIPPDEQVGFFIYFDIDPSRIDVNIHPTKAEIKFDDEQAVFQILSAAVKEAVGKFNAVPQIDFDVEAKPDIPVYDPRNASATTPPPLTLSGSYNPFGSERRSQAAPRDWQRLFDDITRQGPPATGNGAGDSATPDEGGDQSLEGRTLDHYQLKQRYILTSVKSGLMLIDQHRAHTRILYERFLKGLAERKAAGERLIFPQMVQLSQDEQATLASMANDIVAAGFDISDLGDGTFAVNALPSGAEKLDASKLLHDVLADGADARMKQHTDQGIALALAKNAAVAYGTTLTNKDMNNMIDELFATTSPKYTPDGKLIVAIIPQAKIDSMF